MSYVKIDENELKSIKSRLDSALESLITHFGTINNNIPVRRNLEDPNVIDANNKEGTNYLEMGKNYNDSINNIETNMANTDIIGRLSTLSAKIQVIIDAVDDFNNVSFADVEKEIKEISESLSYLDKYTSSEEVSLYAIADCGSGEKNEEKEDTELETIKETNTEGGTSSTEKEEENLIASEEISGEGGTGGETKEEEKRSDNGTENGSEGSAREQKNEDDKQVSDVTNGQSGIVAPPTEDNLTTSDIKNSESEQATADKEDEEHDNEVQNGEIDTPTETETSDPKEPIIGISISGVAPEETEEEEKPDIEIINGLQDQGIRNIDSNPSNSEIKNGEGIDSIGSKIEKASDNQNSNGEIGTPLDKEDEKLDKSVLGGIAGTWGGITPLSSTDEIDNSNEEGNKTSKKEDQDTLSNLTNIGEGLAKGNNDEITKATSTSFLGALFTVLGSIFKKKKKKKKKRI